MYILCRLLISSTNNDSSDYKVVPTLPQGMAIPTVPQPISYIVPLGTEPDINRERFGFRPPPSANPQARHTAGIQPVLPGSSFPVPPFNPSVPTRVPLVPAAQPGSSAVLIDPGLILTEHPPQSSSQLTPSAPGPWDQHLIRRPPNQQPFAPSNSQLTVAKPHTSDNADSESGRDSEDEGDAARWGTRLAEVTPRMMDLSRFNSTAR